MRKVAVNVCDMSELTKGAGGGFTIQLLFVDWIDRSLPSELINQDSRHNIDEGAVVLNGPAAKDEKRLNAFVELLQTVIGPRKLGRRVRCYEEGQRGSWKEIVPKKTPKEAADA